MSLGKKRHSTHNSIVTDDLNKTASKSYARLRDNVLFLNADGKNKVIQIESSIAHEGKTTLACNLAVSLGMTNKKVIIIDLDFRRPKVHQRLDVDIEGGLAEYMLGKLELEQIIKKTKYKNVEMITRGGKVYNSSLVFVSEKFTSFIAKLRETYDYVILDCAPVLLVSDYIHICRVSDGILFAVAYGITSKNYIIDAIRELRRNNANILGSVFTLYDEKKDKNKAYIGEYYYKHYYQKDEQDFDEEEISNAD